jgi:hypothetical protein
VGSESVSGEIVVMAALFGDNHDSTGQLSAAERRRLLDAFDRIVPVIAGRSVEHVSRELRDVRAERRAGGRMPRKS